VPVPEHCAEHATEKVPPPPPPVLQHTSEFWQLLAFVHPISTPPSGHESAHDPVGMAKPPAPASAPVAVA